MRTIVALINMQILEAPFMMVITIVIRFIGSIIPFFTAISVDTLDDLIYLSISQNVLVFLLDLLAVLI